MIVFWFLESWVFLVLFFGGLLVVLFFVRVDDGLVCEVSEVGW